MNDLGPRARSLIDTLLEVDEPSALDRARVRAKIDVRLPAAAAAGTVAATVSGKAGAGAGIAAGTAAGGGAASGGLVAGASLAAGKLVLAVAITGASVTAGVGAYRASQSTPAAPQSLATKIAARSAVSEPVPARAPGAVAPSPSATPRSAPAELEPQPERSSSDRAPGETVASVRAAGPERHEPGPAARALPNRDSVRDEAALLAAARAAITNGDAPLALERLDEHTVRFPSGVLLEERRVLRVLALCASGRASEARSAAAAFMADSPRSPLVSSVRNACAAPSADDLVTKPGAAGHQ
jgi:hypothetical protein